MERQQVCPMDDYSYVISLLAHQRVNTKKKAITIVATLLASISNPQAIREAPMKDDPRYPAGNVMSGIPPDIRVAPPSSAIHRKVRRLGGLYGFDSRSSSMECIRAHVKTPATAWLI